MTTADRAAKPRAILTILAVTHFLMTVDATVMNVSLGLYAVAEHSESSARRDVGKRPPRSDVFVGRVRLAFVVARAVTSHHRTGPSHQHRFG